MTDTTQAERIKAAAAYLRAKRTEAGMTQVQLAELMGITPNAVSVYETGQRAVYPRYVYDAAKALGFDADEVWAILHRAPPDLVERIGASLGNIKSVRTVLDKRERRQGR